jgi:type II secretory pathway predicted ATPase ExeA
MFQTREQVRAGLRVYMSATGLSQHDIAERAGFAPPTLHQFLSRAKFGTSAEAGETAQTLAAWMAENPPNLPAFPGRIYETEGTRAMRELIADAKEGIWGTCYAPYGAQKTFLFETVFAESARESTPWFALVEAVERMSPRMLLAAIARAIAAPYAQYATALRDAILGELRRREAPLVVAIDEAQLLYPMIDTLECLRRLGDLARGLVGVIIAGNEQVVNLFEARRRTSMGQWRSRVEQRRLRVYGPSEAEAREIARQELGTSLSDRQIEFLIKRSIDTDPLPEEDGTQRKYVNLRRMFNAMRDYRREHRKAT